MGRTRRTHSRSESRQQSPHPIRLVCRHILGGCRIDNVAVSAPIEPRPAKYIASWESFNPRLTPQRLQTQVDGLSPTHQFAPLQPLPDRHFGTPNRISPHKLASSPESEPAHSRLGRKTRTPALDCES